jgi:hypothetical protein
LSTERKPRVTRDKRMVRQIRAIMDEMEAQPDGTHTVRSLKNYLADIADVLDENPAAQEAA